MQSKSQLTTSTKAETEAGDNEVSFDWDSDMEIGC